MFALGGNSKASVIIIAMWLQDLPQCAVDIYRLSVSSVVGG